MIAGKVVCGMALVRKSDYMVEIIKFHQVVLHIFSVKYGGITLSGY